jgi:hypothetical protein
MRICRERDDALLDRIMQRNHRFTLSGDSLCQLALKNPDMEIKSTRRDRFPYNLNA